jgi:hypothetical protein
MPATTEPPAPDSAQFPETAGTMSWATINGRIEAGRRERQILTRVSRAARRPEQAGRERAWTLAPARAEGISIRTLATATGLSPSRVHQLVADAGLDALDAAFGEPAPTADKAPRCTARGWPTGAHRHPGPAGPPRAEPELLSATSRAAGQVRDRTDSAIWRDQRGGAICHALTVRDEQGPGLVATEEILVGAHEDPAEARLSAHGFTSAVIGRGPVSGPGTRPRAQFWSHSPPSGAVHRRPRPPVRTAHGRWRPVVNSGAQYPKACEGASLPWVQIPPPPPLTCDDASPPCLLGGGGHRGGLSFGPQMVSVDRARYPRPAGSDPNSSPALRRT